MFDETSDKAAYKQCPGIESREEHVGGSQRDICARCLNALQQQQQTTTIRQNERECADDGGEDGGSTIRVNPVLLAHAVHKGCDADVGNGIDGCYEDASPSNHREDNKFSPSLRMPDSYIQF